MSIKCIPLADALRHMAKEDKSNEEDLNLAADYVIELAEFEKVARDHGWSEEINTTPWHYLADRFSGKNVEYLLDPSNPPRLVLPRCQVCHQYRYEWMIVDGYWTAECPGCENSSGAVRVCFMCSGSGYVEKK